jgi:hypothetical protein
LAFVAEADEGADRRRPGNSEPKPRPAVPIEVFAGEALAVAAQLHRQTAAVPTGIEPDPDLEASTAGPKALGREQQVTMGVRPDWLGSEGKDCHDRK